MPFGAGMKIAGIEGTGALLAAYPKTAKLVAAVGEYPVIKAFPKTTQNQAAFGL